MPVIGRMLCCDIVLIVLTSGMLLLLSRRLANTIVPWNQVRALVSNRLIALDKCPGVRPVGVGETLRWVVGKGVCMAVRIDIEDLCGVDQLCGGLSLRFMP